MTRAVDLLKNKFGVSQLYKHDVIKDNVRELKGVGLFGGTDDAFVDYIKP